MCTAPVCFVMCPGLADLGRKEHGQAHLLDLILQFLDFIQMPILIVEDLHEDIPEQYLT